MKGMEVAVLVAILLMAAQSYLTYKQAMNYRASIKAMMKGGNYVAAGMRRNFLTHGRVMLIACNDDQIITNAMEMKGITVFERFKPFDKYNGMTIYELWEQETEKLNAKKPRKTLGGKVRPLKDTPEMQALRGLINRFRERAPDEMSYLEEEKIRLAKMDARPFLVRTFFPKKNGQRLKGGW